VVRSGRRWALIGLALVALTSCDTGRRKAAETAIARAERMVTALKDRAVKVMPDRTQALIDSLEVAKKAAAAGEFGPAAATAGQVATDAIDIANSLAGKSTQLTSDFMAFSAELPGRVDAIEQKARRGAPAGVDRAAFGALVADLPVWRDEWKAAVKAYQEGDLAIASSKAKALKAKIAEAENLLGISPAPEAQ